jgi:site-specific recombinase XerD
MAENICSDIPEKVYPHMFRRTMGTAMYQSGVALSLVSKFLEHAQMETTKQYIAVFGNDEKNAVFCSLFRHN